MNGFKPSHFWLCQSTKKPPKKDERLVLFLLDRSVFILLSRTERVSLIEENVKNMGENKTDRT